jgi:hypothetical protein
LNVILSGQGLYPFLYPRFLQVLIYCGRKGKDNIASLMQVIGNISVRQNTYQTEGGDARLKQRVLEAQGK